MFSFILVHAYLSPPPHNSRLDGGLLCSLELGLDETCPNDNDLAEIDGETEGPLPSFDGVLLPLAFDLTSEDLDICCVAFC